MITTTITCKTCSATHTVQDIPHKGKCPMCQADYFIIDKVTIDTIEDFNNNLKYLPQNVIYDISNRMKDWLDSDGTMADDYIRKQFKYAENVINIGRIKELK